MLPIRRDLHFALPAERITDWHEQGPFITHFFNALSLLFPQGELFFMDSVRHYRQRVDDPALKKQIHGDARGDPAERSVTLWRFAQGLPTDVVLARLGRNRTQSCGI
jgi:hypothetical protein